MSTDTMTALRQRFPRLEFSQLPEQEHYEAACGVLTIAVWQPIPGDDRPWNCTIARGGRPTRGPTAAEAVERAICAAREQASDTIRSCAYAGVL
mgnify:CR=1 FL=1